VVVYGATLFSLWYWTGSPDGPERDIMTVHTGLRAHGFFNRGRGSKTVL
jgi:hypothetical protein